MHFPLRVCAIMLIGAFVGVGGVAAQQPIDDEKKAELKKQDTVPPATAPKLSEQAGTTEPSSKVPGTSTDPNAVFVKGVLVVPGAMTDVDTAPAKHWQRTDADDQIPIAGYRLKSLSPEAMSKIAEHLKSQRDAPEASAAGGAYAAIGAEIPSVVADASLVPVPETLSAAYPQLRGTAYMRSAGKILIVVRNSSIVVGVLEG
jgi:hypothetical protein